VILWTGPYTTRDPDRLDITRAGCDKALRARKAAPGEFLAPSAGLVFPALEAMKAAQDDAERDAIWSAYAREYRLEMLTSWKNRRREWTALLARERVVLVCFCRDPQRCHRTLAAGFLARLGADYRGEIEAASTKAAYVRGEVAKGQTRSHHCHARDCDRQVPPAFFMCARHWKMVPRALQAQVWAHYRPGQEKGEVGVTAEYCRVADEAIAAVTAKEGKPAPEPVAKRLTIDDLTPHDRAEVDKYTRYLGLVAAIGKGPEARTLAYSTVYGGSP
jgi:uncharacterized protein YeaO (DUF488 family)